MSSLSDRMQWRPGMPSPPLDLKDVLAALRVEDASEVEQRRVVAAAVERGDLGAPSLDAVREAGWLDASDAGRPGRARLPSAD